MNLNNKVGIEIYVKASNHHKKVHSMEWVFEIFIDLILFHNLETHRRKLGSITYNGIDLLRLCNFTVHRRNIDGHVVHICFGVCVPFSRYARSASLFDDAQNIPSTNWT